MERLYFAYGSNMSSRRLTARIDGARALGAARIPHSRLVFDKPGRDGSAKANLAPDPGLGRWVWGVVWSVSGLALDTLDRFEPGYDRLERRVLFADGRERAAATYVWRGDPVLAAPAAWYLEHLLAGAREHALPPAWRALLGEAHRGARASRR
ncbi:MAG: gamma-glutamylcyclotransferase family protein [Myxococcota bacterium]